jgi:hypothetical protein
MLVKVRDWDKELQLKPEELRNELFLSTDNDNVTGCQKAVGSVNVDVLLTVGLD